MPGVRRTFYWHLKLELNFCERRTLKKELLEFCEGTLKCENKFPMETMKFGFIFYVFVPPTWLNFAKFAHNTKILKISK